MKLATGTRVWCFYTVQGVRSTAYYAMAQGFNPTAEELNIHEGEVFGEPLEGAQNTYMVEVNGQLLHAYRYELHTSYASAEANALKSMQQGA